MVATPRFAPLRTRTWKTPTFSVAATSICWGVNVCMASQLPTTSQGGGGGGGIAATGGGGGGSAARWRRQAGARASRDAATIRARFMAFLLDAPRRRSTHFGPPKGSSQAQLVNQ